VAERIIRISQNSTTQGKYEMSAQPGDYICQNHIELDSAPMAFAASCGPNFWRWKQGSIDFSSEA